MTGGGFGNCAGNPAPGFITQPPARGRGSGRGGYGRRHRLHAGGLTGWQGSGMHDFGGRYGDPYPATSPAHGAAALRAEAERLERIATAMRGRAGDLEQLSTERHASAHDE